MEDKTYKSVFISDVHLGSKYCNATAVSTFLKQHTCENLFLVGDIIDGWALSRKWYFPQEHVNVIRRILTDAKRGTRVVYIVGNHDEMFRSWVDLEINFGNIELANEMTYEDIHGNKWLIAHGDIFDAVMKHRWLTWIGDHAYTLLTASNRFLNSLRKTFGLGYWSLSKWAKAKTKLTLNFIYEYENHIALYAKNKGYVGVICGHLHVPAIKKINDILYVNDGDFCETCSAAVERHDGKFELLEMNKEGQFVTKCVFTHEGIEHIYF